MSLGGCTVFHSHLKSTVFFIYFFASFAIIKGLFPLHNDNVLHFQMTRLSLFSLQCFFYDHSIYKGDQDVYFYFISFCASKVSMMRSGPLERQIANAT